MSLFSGLFGARDKKVGVDKTVDDLFQNSTGPIAAKQLKKSRTVIEPVGERGADKDADEEMISTSEGDEKDSGEDSDDDGGAGVHSEAFAGEKSKRNVKHLKKKSGKLDNDEDLESRYFDRLMKKEKVSGSTGEDLEAAKDNGSDIQEDSEQESDDSEDSGSKQENKKELKESKKAVAVDLKEAELEKADRTVFVGNVAVDVIKSKTVLKQFKKLFSAFGDVQSVRFRSISFDDVVPRKVAFFRKNIGDSRDTVNAYVVFKDKESSFKCISHLNASVFHDFHLRVDHLAHPAPTDNRRTIFIGGLDFEEKEESLWRYFNAHTDGDVESVRIVRDSKTNFGKGFAFVQFKDSLSVNKALMLNDKPMSEGKKRKIRVTRAKASAKPSLLSPNHVENMKKSKRKLSPSQLSEKQRTKLGRAMAVLGKADKKSVGNALPILEGQRASKGALISGVKGLKLNKVKKPRTKKPRIRERSTNFRKQLVNSKSENSSLSFKM